MKDETTSASLVCAASSQGMTLFISHQSPQNAMEPILTRCGYRCDLCLAYRPNVEKNPSDQQKLSDGWYKYFGFRLSPTDILCDGCMEEDPMLIDKNCPVRPCVIERNLNNCAQCAQFLCEKLKERLVTYEEIRSKMEHPISEEDYRDFIQPYENKRRLDAIRESQRD